MTSSEAQSAMQPASPFSITHGRDNQMVVGKLLTRK